jgi:TonB family protein
VAQTAHDLLDAAAVNAVKKAAPYPRPPEQLEGEQFQILVPVVFKFTQ